MNKMKQNKQKTNKRKRTDTTQINAYKLSHKARFLHGDVVVVIDKGVNTIFICYKVLEFCQPVCKRVSLFSRRL